MVHIDKENDAIFFRNISLFHFKDATICIFNAIFLSIRGNRDVIVLLPFFTQNSICSFYIKE